MAQHDYNLANQPGATFRADVNAALEAVASKNSGATTPSVTFAYMWWVDTTNSLLKIRNSANTSWITVGTLSSLLTLSVGILPFPASGNWWGTTTRVPLIGTNGVMEVGSIIDFHAINNDASDYQTRFNRGAATNDIFIITQTGTGGINIQPGTGGITLFTSSVGFLPVGAVIPWFGSAVPNSGTGEWIFLNGQNINRTTYSDLFALWGTTYGAGNGSTTFTVPDLRGRVLAGKDNMGGVSANRLTAVLTGGINGDVLGAVGGDEAHGLLTAQIPVHLHANTAATATTVNAGGSHAHSVPIVDDDGNFGATGFPNSSRTSVLGFIATDTVANHTHTATSITTMTNANAGSGADHNNVQPTFIVNYVCYARNST